jgi:hypothetical protein
VDDTRIRLAEELLREGVMLARAAVGGQALTSGSASCGLGEKAEVV